MCHHLAGATASLNALTTTSGRGTFTTCWVACDLGFCNHPHRVPNHQGQNTYPSMQRTPHSGNPLGTRWLDHRSETKRLKASLSVPRSNHSKRPVCHHPWGTTTDAANARPLWKLRKWALSDAPALASKPMKEDEVAQDGDASRQHVQQT